MMIDHTLIEDIETWAGEGSVSIFFCIWIFFLYLKNTYKSIYKM